VIPKSGPPPAFSNETRATGGRPAEALRACGLRLTRPRRLILEVVRASDAHSSATVVHELVRRRLPRVSLATVYRNLRRLASEGLLRERVEAAGLRFDGNLATHDHFTCVTCGRIYDVPADSGRAARARVASATGFEVLRQRIEFYGRCRRCRRTERTAVTRRREKPCPHAVSRARRASRIRREP
jgi:Fur family transcriptional regulator, peroxide stress response regulator